MNRRISTAFGIIVVLLIAGFFGGLFWLDYQNKKNADGDMAQYARPGVEKNLKEEVEKELPSEEKFCTQEAKECPDGNFVGRDPDNNCQFRPCPGENNIVGNDRDEHGCIGSAGYSWCEEKQKCLRSWEENCN